MNLIRDIFLLGLVILGSVNGQVCCSLVGAIDQGGGASSTNWNTHWPSSFYHDREWKWSAGLNSSGTGNREHRIKYGFAASGFIQVAHSFNTKTAWYSHLELNRIKISESLSFEGSETGITQFGFRTGIRYLLPSKFGYLSGEVYLPGNPVYSNDDFSFRTGAVPAYTVAWNGIITYPGLQYIPELIPEIYAGMSYKNNISKKDNVFIDDVFQFHLSTIISPVFQLDIAPYINSNIQKLLAPISPWESERQSRWLGIITLGTDITPSSERWNWLHIRLAVPVYGWYSEVGFPDGTQPSPIISLLISKSGSIGKNSRNNINYK
jgi:hypothetical protein